MAGPYNWNKLFNWNEAMQLYFNSHVRISNSYINELQKFTHTHYYVRIYTAYSNLKIKIPWRIWWLVYLRKLANLKNSCSLWFSSAKVWWNLEIRKTRKIREICPICNCLYFIYLKKLGYHDEYDELFIWKC